MLHQEQDQSNKTRTVRKEVKDFWVHSSSIWDKIIIPMKDENKIFEIQKEA